MELYALTGSAIVIGAAALGLLFSALQQRAERQLRDLRRIDKTGAALSAVGTQSVLAASTSAGVSSASAISLGWRQTGASILGSNVPAPMRSVTDELMPVQSLGSTIPMMG